MNGGLGSHLPNCVVTVVWSGCPTTWAGIWSRVLPVRIRFGLGSELLVPLIATIVMVHTPSLYWRRGWHSLSPPLSWRFWPSRNSKSSAIQKTATSRLFDFTSLPAGQACLPTGRQEGKGEGVFLALYSLESVSPSPLSSPQRGEEALCHIRLATGQRLLTLPFFPLSPPGSLPAGQACLPTDTLCQEVFEILSHSFEKPY